MALLSILAGCASMEASQQEFLTEIYEAPTITVSDLIQAGVRLGRSSECARPRLSAEVKQRALEYLRHAPECTRSPNTHSTAACWPGPPWKARLGTLASSAPTCAMGTPAANARESCPLSKWPERVSRPIMSLARRSAMGGELLDCHLRCSLFCSRAVACRNVYRITPAPIRSLSAAAAPCCWSSRKATLTQPSPNS